MSDGEEVAVFEGDGKEDENEGFSAVVISGDLEQVKAYLVLNPGRLNVVR